MTDDSGRRGARSPPSPRWPPSRKAAPGMHATTTENARLLTRAPLPSLVYEREPGAAARPLPGRYRRREPEKTALYAVVGDHLETFLREGQDLGPSGGGYPPFVAEEFRKYLSCGQLSNGFARLRCPACRAERLVAFSCKGRLCPSCWALRAADLAADLVDRLLPATPYRQYVLTFPWDSRYKLATDRRFLSEMLGGFLRTLFAWQRLRGRRLGLIARAGDGHTGAVSFVQRFTGSLSLFPHVHSLVPDGLFVAGPDPGGPLSFVSLPPPTDDDITDLTLRVVRRLTKIARRHLGDDDSDVSVDAPDACLLRSCAAEALRSPPAPQLLSPADAVARTRLEKPLAARLDGFSLHAARVVPAHRRAELERLCRYGLRAPFSVERFSLLDDGRVRYDLLKPTADGRTELRLQPVALLRRLAALLPRPFTQLVRYHGVFANRSRFRPLLPPPPASPQQDGASLLEDPPPAAVQPPVEPDSSTAPAQRPARRRLPWAELLLRVLDVDALKCPKCSTSMIVLAFLTDPKIVRRVLSRLSLPTTLPAVAPARVPDEQLDLEFQDVPADSPSDDGETLPAARNGRGPPGAA